MNTEEKQNFYDFEKIKAEFTEGKITEREYINISCDLYHLPKCLDHLEEIKIAEKKKTVKLIINNHCSKRDINGNCYWFSVIQSTETGKHCEIHTDSETNTEHYIRQYIKLDWREFVATTIEHPIREFNRLKKDINYTSPEESMEIIKGIMA